MNYYSVCEFAYALDAQKEVTAKKKSPFRQRSAAIVEAIYEAVIQVLLKVGVKNITTTRVAELAGVSVGLYSVRLGTPR